MIRRPPRSTRTDTLFPYTTLFRSHQDYTVSGGTRFLRETNDVAVLAGISIPLGRFDRNQGNLARAQAERRQPEFQSEASRLERLRGLAAHRAAADAARVRAEGVMTDVHHPAGETTRPGRDGRAARRRRLDSM